jgi:hypothetical protein
MRHRLACMMLIGLTGIAAAAAEKQEWDVATAARPLLSALSGTASEFEIIGSVTLPVDDRPQSVDIRLTRYAADSFDLVLEHQDYAVSLRRRENTTAMALPKHGVVFVGTGPVHGPDQLGCEGMWEQLVSTDSELAMVAFTFRVLVAADIDAFVATTMKQTGFAFDQTTGRWQAGSSTLASEAPGNLTITTDAVTVSLTTSLVVSAPQSPTDWPGLKPVSLPRDELETTLVRGVRRAGEILRPGPALLNPPRDNRQTDHGRLTWVEGHRVATLWGTPEQIGTAHGQLLSNEARRCIESVLYTFGTAHAIRTGRWFRHDLDDAYARLKPHIPERHLRETRAMAVALSIPPREAEILNVFPELFHCSGFAVFDSATVDGKLYHGRVLDYMTTIGLQDAATTFIVRPDGLIPFANVGYGGFTGSVSGMNAEGISLGEMGGRGEGNWDGVPMATLMRRALEECDSLQDVKAMWRDNPRTCEYYYVFADGKTNDAVGVAATPDSLEFVAPGEGHELLGSGIPDAVVLSAGSRLEELRRRVLARHGAIDADTAMWLMSRPVAMESNLHNVLFVPADGIFYVANAGHGKPAAEMPAVRLDLNALLGSIATEERTSTAAE